MKLSIKDFFSKCDQIRSSLRIWSHLLKKSLMENFIFCAVFHASYKQLFIARVTSYFLQLSYELLFIVRVVVNVITSANLGTPWFILNIENTS